MTQGIDEMNLPVLNLRVMTTCSLGFRLASHRSAVKLGMKQYSLRHE